MSRQANIELYDKRFEVSCYRRACHVTLQHHACCCIILLQEASDAGINFVVEFGGSDSLVCLVLICLLYFSSI